MLEAEVNGPPWASRLMASPLRCFLLLGGDPTLEEPSLSFPFPDTLISLSHTHSFTLCPYRILEFEGKNRDNLELDFRSEDIDLYKGEVIYLRSLRKLVIITGTMFSNLILRLII